MKKNDFTVNGGSTLKGLCAFLLVTFTYLGLFFLHEAVADLIYTRNMAASLGGGSAIYFLFFSRSYFSKITTLFSFMMSSAVLFVCTYFQEADLSIFILLTLASSFFFAFFFISYFELDPFFIIIFCFFLNLIGLEWAIAFLVELTILFFFQWVEMENSYIKKNLLLSFNLLLLVCFYFHFIGVHPGFRIGVVIVLGMAGAGGLQFLCLNKAEHTQAGGFFLYLLSNILLGFILKKEGEIVPKSTFVFLISILLFFVFFFLVSKMKGAPVSSIISQSKTLLRGIFFPCLFFFDTLFFDGAYFIWIGCFVIHVLILLLLKFILENEDKDPILENEEKG